MNKGLRMTGQEFAALCQKTGRRNPLLKTTEPAPTEPTKKPGKKRRQMNKTEALYSKILDVAKNRGEITSYEYEGMTLRWGTLDSIAYTPDFVTIKKSAGDSLLNFVKFIEVKGAKIWAKDIQKFKAARNQWPMFLFQMWQYKSGTWTQLL